MTKKDVKHIKFYVYKYYVFTTYVRLAYNMYLPKVKETI